MSLIVLMYHHAREGHLGNSAEMLDAHFAHISSEYHCILPGEPVTKDKLNVCLMFDDGYRDFYTTVYPLLQKYELRAVLAVSPHHIRAQQEIAVPWGKPHYGTVAFDPSLDREFCNWAELQSMAESGIVSVAAHGLTHCRLDGPNVDIANEVVLPRQTIAEKLNCLVSSFVFPYGRFSQPVLRKVREHYRYAFRIGGADNKDWSGRVIYRVSADNMESFDSLFTKKNRAIYRLRRFWNILRRC